MEVNGTNCPFALNNEGVKLAMHTTSRSRSFDQNDHHHDGAIRCFSQALQECRNILDHMERRFAAGSSTSSLKSLGIRKTASIGIQTGWRFIDPYASPLESSCFIYDRLLLVAKESENSSRYAEYVQLSFVILFNLAVMIQLHGQNVASEESRSAMLLQALTLYEMARDLESQAENFQAPTVCLMALVNNMGQIHKALGDDEKARQCFEHLLVLYMVLLVRGQQAALSDLEGFLANATQAIETTDSTEGAPAA